MELFNVTLLVTQYVEVQGKTYLIRFMKLDLSGFID